MSLFKDRLARAVRANLNELLDRVKEFEERGGFGAFGQQAPHGDRGWEDIGSGQPHAHHGPDGSLTAPRREKTLRDYYANLEVEYGADLPTVKASYRRLMTRYHPDKHAHDPKMEALATELSQELARAYQAVESYLLTGRY